MKHLQHPSYYMLFLLFVTITLQGMAQNMVSYAYDYAGNRISRKIVLLGSNPSHVKKTADPATTEEKLGDRVIKVFPNPTKGALAIDINGGNEKDELRIIVFDANGKQLLNKKIEAGTTPVNMGSYPVAYYILRVQAGERMTEFKIIKQ
jgi:hypothetical protein